MHFLSLDNDNVRRTSNRDSFGYQSGYKTGCSGPVIYSGGNSRLLHSPQSDDEPPPPPKFVENNFDEVDDYDGDSSNYDGDSSCFITSNMADRTMRKLSEQNAAGKKTYKIQ